MNKTSLTCVIAIILAFASTITVFVDRSNSNKMQERFLLRDAHLTFEDGYQYFLAKNWPYCIKRLEQHKKIVTKPNKEVFWILGLAYENTAQYDKAIAEYSAALQGENDIKNLILLRRGQCFYLAKNYTAAINDFNAAEQIKDSQIQKSELYGLRARSYVGLQDYSNAYKEYERIIKEDPVATLLNEYAFLLGLTGPKELIDHDKAVLIAKRAMNMDKENARQIATLGALYSAKYGDKKALEMLDQEEKAK